MDRHDLRACSTRLYIQLENLRTGLRAQYLSSEVYCLTWSYRCAFKAERLQQALRFIDEELYG